MNVFVDLPDIICYCAVGKIKMRKDLVIRNPIFCYYRYNA